MNSFAMTAASTTSAVLSLGKQAWKLGIALSKLDQETKDSEITFQSLTDGIKSLGIECDLVYAGLDAILNRSEREPPPLYNIDERSWSCLDSHIEKIKQTFQELEMFVARVRGERSSFYGGVLRQRTLDECKDHIGAFRTKVCRHADNLQTMLLLINTIHMHITPCRVDQQLCGELEKLQDMIEKLHQSSEADPKSPPSRADADLMQHAREVLSKGRTMYEASLFPRSAGGGQEAASSNKQVAEWVDTLEMMHQEKRCLDASEIKPSIDPQQGKILDTSADSDDDLDTELAKAALDMGTKAFEEQEWVEAISLLQEALQLLQQLPKQQRTSCDIFGLHYKLAVCAYHTQDSADAEVTLASFVHQSVSSDDQRGCIYEATHLLSQLYIRIGKIDRARSECEKVLQGRRRLLGKRNDASLESIALMAHIYILLNNRARAKSLLSMIPEERREAIVKRVEDSMSNEVEHLDFSSLQTRQTSGDLAEERLRSRLSGSTVGLAIEDQSYRPLPAIPKTPAPSIGYSFRESSDQTGLESPRSVIVAPLSPPTVEAQFKAKEVESPNEEYSVDAVTTDAASLRLTGSPQVKDLGIPKSGNSARKAILDKIGCQPRDRIEEAVCNGDHSALSNLLDKKKDFWKSKLRKRVRPERLTALHFAALFGEIDMARRLLSSSFNINDVPYGYTTSLSPLKMAVGARQVNMVEFLILNGARPTDPDTWSTLAGQLMSRPWLVKTLVESEEEFVPNQIVVILSILLKQGWDINEPFESSGNTILHQAVAFWTGSYNWDLNLRAVITSFLCEQGANPFQENKEGKTAYDIALASGHQDLLMHLDPEWGRKEMADTSADPIELSSETPFHYSR